jgi:glycosyltransferase involved in cell wall biosynthesis
VVLPVFNRMQVVERAIESVLAQTLADFELLVVDDGSSDGTGPLLARIGDPRLRILTLPSNGGACAARNAGIEAALSEIVCFLDSDDVYLPSKLEHVVARFAAAPELDLLVDSFVSRKTLGHKRRVQAKRNPPGLTGHDFRAAVFERRIAKATTALSVRRRALLDVGLFDPTLRRRQDLDLVLRLSRKHVCESTDAILWEKHESRDAISRDHGLFLQASIDICDRHPEYLELHAVSLHRDLRSHFVALLKRGEGRAFYQDARRYAAYPRFAHSLLGLLLDGRLSRGPRVDSIQRTLADSESPSRTAETSCAPARVEK